MNSSLHIDHQVLHLNNKKEVKDPRGTFKLTYKLTTPWVPGRFTDETVVK